MIIENKLIGNKNNKDLYNNLLGQLLPKYLILYIEPFGGQFGLYEMLNRKPTFSVYNDINTELYEQVKNRFENENEKIYFFNKDYKEVMRNYNVENAFFYIDPPYYKKFYYKYNFAEKDHIELYEELKNIKGRFLLSYQDRPFIRKLYKGYNFYKYTGNNFMLKPEIAITNY